MTAASLLFLVMVFFCAMGFIRAQNRWTARACMFTIIMLVASTFCPVVGPWWVR
jgi:hypothetical protein